ncbi:MAG: ActS/PrrB/RegB family redox-sensitive histidine kinase [Pseudomonadota bacterium]
MFSESASHSFFNGRARGDWVRLRTLIVLRWLAITGQSAAVLLASRFYDFDLPLTLCALVISASVSVNLVAYLTHPAEKRLSERGTMLSLFFDLAQLVALLMLTGGMDNPFSVLILAPVTISATALRIRSTLVLGVAALAALPLLLWAPLPLYLLDGTRLQVPGLYAGGLAVAVAIGVVFLSLYVRRVAVEGFRMSEALTATQIALAREQRLAAIGGIAAAAAHELGTPLATIKLVAGELARELKHDEDLAEDARLIREQAERCGEIMADLSRSKREDDHLRHAPVSAVVEEAAQPHAERGKHLVIRVDGLPLAEAAEEQPHVRRMPELIHGLRNLIQNAVDFAAETVWIDIVSSEDGLRVAVGDDGPGFSEDILPRLGEPYVSTRARGSRAGDAAEYEGMGLGLFIARTLLERTGGTLAFANGSDAMRRRQRLMLPPELAHPPGAIIEIRWPPDSIEVPTEEQRAALGGNRRYNPVL